MVETSELHTGTPLHGYLVAFDERAQLSLVHEDSGPWNAADR